MESLETTNIMLGIMAVVSVLEGLLIIGIAIAGWKAYRSVMDLVSGLEERHVAPVTARVNSMLDDLKHVTTTVKDETDRVDHAIHRTMDRVDDTAHRVRHSVVAKTSRLVGFIRGARVAIETLLEDHNRNLPVRTH
jgi:pyrimidine operon attenuation protein/uracil phosphoribosyltransferase